MSILSFRNIFGDIYEQAFVKPALNFSKGRLGDFFEKLVQAHNRVWPRPKLLILNFPHNPTTATVDLEFFEKVVGNTN